MLEAKVVDTIQADIESVWAELGNFSGIKPGRGHTALLRQWVAVDVVRASVVAASAKLQNHGCTPISRTDSLSS